MASYDGMESTAQENNMYTNVIIDPKAAGVICPICLEIYSDPVQISCGNGHTYCRDCVSEYGGLPEPECPLCRGQFRFDELQPAEHIQHLLSQNLGGCQGCNKQMRFTELKTHVKSCKYVDRSVPQFQPVMETTQQIPSNVPNRSTFVCPYCGLKNLDCKGLTEHCNATHSRAKEKVVCPICVVMPWGDPNLKSADFIQHLNTRHKFEYDTYVDYNQDDDEMLKIALMKSMEDCN